MPMCYELLTRPILFEVEAFNPRSCPKDDLWPCPGMSKTQLPKNLGFEPNLNPRNEPLIPRLEWLPIEYREEMTKRFSPSGASGNWCNSGLCQVRL